MNEAINGGLPRLSDFPVGSPESRASARAMAARKIKTRILVRIIHVGKSVSDVLGLPYRVESEASVVEFVHVGGSDP